MSTDKPEWICPKCKQPFELCICGPGDEEDGKELPTTDRPTRDDPEDNGVSVPGYNSPSPGSPISPVHIQFAGQRYSDRNSHEQRGMEI